MASVDVGLTITVARNVAKTVQLYTAKCEELVRDLVDIYYFSLQPYISL